jgi:RNA recognition motif-containing protein
MQIYVGNLPKEFTDADLRALFEAHGVVKAASIGTEKKTGESQGYGFVEMPTKAEARAAVEALRGKVIKGNPLRVRALKPDDEFHHHAMSLHASSQPGGAPPKTSTRFRGDIVPRAGGAIRRSGRRGS